MPDINPEDGLTLPEMRLKQEGDAMLQSIAGQDVKLTPVLGPDGQPLEGVQLATGKAPPEVDAHARETLKKGMNDKLTELRKASRAEMEAALKIAGEVLDDNPLAKKCSKAMLALYQALAWAKLELQMSDERIDDTVLTHMERQVQAAVYHGEGFWAQKLLQVIPNDVVALIDKQTAKYEKAVKSRRIKIASQLSRFELNGRTFTLPAPQMQEAFPKGKFVTGGMVIITGTPEAVRQGLLLCARVHRRNDCGAAHFLAVDGQPKFKEEGIVYVAQSWWQDAVATIGRMYARLKIVVDSNSSALVVEDFNPLLRVAADVMAPSERVSRVFSALQQWSVENAVLLFIGAPSEGEAPNYGGLPQFEARIYLNEMMSKKSLVMADYTFPL